MNSDKVEAALAEAKKLAATNGDLKGNGADPADSAVPEAIVPETAKEPAVASKGEKRKSTEEDGDDVEKVEFKVIFNKKKTDVSFPLDSDVAALKVHLQPIVGIPPVKKQRQVLS